MTTSEIRNLVEGLKDDNRRERKRAAKALSRIGADAITTLTELITGDRQQYWHRHARLRAIDALGMMGEVASPAVPTLCKFLRSDLELSIRVLRALSKMGPSAQDALPHVLLGLEKHDWKTIYPDINSFLCELGSASLPTLRRLLSSNQRVLQIFGLFVLRNLGEDARPALNAIAMARSTRSWRVRWAAIETEFELTDNLDLIRVALDDPEQRVGISGLRTLAADRSEAAPLVIEALQNRSPRIRRNAARILLSKDPLPSGAPFALARAFGEASGVPVEDLLDELRKTAGPFDFALPAVLQTLHHPDPKVRDRTLDVLVAWHKREKPSNWIAREASQHVAELLRDEDDRVRRSVVQTLQYWNVYDKGPDIVALSSDPYKFVRQDVALTIGWWGDEGHLVPDALPRLMALLADSAAIVRIAAIKAIRLCKIQSCAELIVSAVVDDNSELLQGCADAESIREEAVEALTVIGTDQQAITALRKALDANHSRVRPAAVAALAERDAMVDVVAALHLLAEKYCFAREPVLKKINSMARIMRERTDDEILLDLAGKPYLMPPIRTWRSEAIAALVRLGPDFPGVSDALARVGRGSQLPSVRRITINAINRLQSGEENDPPNG